VRLEQIVRNLLGNAIKFTQLGGRIELMLERKEPPDPAMGAWGLLRIRDNGIGIAPEMQPHVFDPFTQANHSIARTQGGLGLGLAMVRSLVQMHGGQVAALSDGVGCGSEFIVRIPLCTEPATSATFSPSGEAQEPATKQKREGLKILIVDNNRDAVEGLQELLTLWGHEAKGVYSGLEAIVESPVFQPDMILMDIGLPGMNGFEACRRLHQEPSLEGVVMIAVTGYGREEDRSMAAESGFSHFLVKPVELGRLRKIIAEVVAARR
jgi:two-component system CheB/CheR fusion protein